MVFACGIIIRFSLDQNEFRERRIAVETPNNHYTVIPQPHCSSTISEYVMEEALSFVHSKSVACFAEVFL